MIFPEPSPAIVAFVFLQIFLYVPLVAVLAVLRAAVARGPARLWAMGAILLAAVAMFLQFGPAILGLYEGWLPIFAGQTTRLGQGLALPLAPSLPLLVSGLVRGRRWRGIDMVHIALIVILIGLFAASRLS